MYTIGQAAARAGVSVPLLRAWERRYGIVTPARTPAGYRLYDRDALDRLRTMRRLVDSGWTPRNAAAAILDGSVPADVRQSTEAIGADATEAMALEVPRSFVDRFIAAARDLDEARLEQTLDEMFAAGSFEQIAETHVLPALAALGEAWASGEIDVAAEHLASHSVQRRLAAAFQAAGRPTTGDGAILVGLPPGARHELGGLAFAVATRRAGLEVLYLGPDLPVTDWVDAAVRTRTRAAVIGSVIDADAAAAAQVARAIHEIVPRALIAFGGRTAGDAIAVLGGMSPATSIDVLHLPDGVVPAVAAIAGAVHDK
jgi:DNA-binding transcriptional MerR regulator/methylmalonyl-CoA mutase cobalamin-binding subunit